MLSEQIILRAIFESSAEGIIISDNKGEIVKANPKSEKMFAYDRGELVGKKIEDLIPSRFLANHHHYREGFYEKPKPRSMGKGLDLYAKRKDNSEFPVEVSLSYSRIGDEMLVIAFLINITERKKAEKQLLQSEEQLRYYMTNSPAAIAMTDCDLKYLLVSDRWIEEYKFEQKDLVGLSHPEVFPDYQKNWDTVYEKCLKGEIIRCEEDKIHRSDGTIDWLRWEVHPWRDANGQIGGLIMFNEVITTRKLAEEALKKSRAKLRDYTIQLERSNRELEDFAYISSHDLQEPLRKIQTFGDRIKRKEAENLTEKGQDYLNRMLSSASRMQKLINDLLTLSRVSTKMKAFETVDLNHILEEVLSDLEHSIERNKVTITIDSLPKIEGDPTQLRQLFQNLISNAIKFKKDGEDPVITIELKQPTDSTEDKIEIHVRDNGIGFDEKYLDRIFNIFQRIAGRQYEGSGIGLSICKKIAIRHGGNITAHSTSGEGSTFIVILAEHASEKNAN
ncbi:PAS domain S-box protein [Flammeovirgaceae bacterium SG7u.111]|nr:PAS domain S-box protein [Flammeovirgaceae bacterium SG7u.132]WPO33981.1 PAS domain S-box protein [Flammeovirgaceae bacterium SG7u.111]